MTFQRLMGGDPPKPEDVSPVGAAPPPAIQPINGHQLEAGAPPQNGNGSHSSGLAARMGATTGAAYASAAPAPPAMGTTPLPYAVPHGSTLPLPGGLPPNITGQLPATTTGQLPPNSTGQLAQLPVHTAPVATQIPTHLVQALVQRILAGFPPSTTLERTPEIEQMLAGRFMAALSQVPGGIPAGAQEALFRAVVDEILGFGPLEPLLNDESVTEVMVNGPSQVWVERKGQLIESGITFQDDAHVMRVAQRIVAPLGRRIDSKWPMVDARLPDGSRVNIIAAPCALQGTTITIRKFFKSPLKVQNLIEFGTITANMADFLKACVQGRLNIIVAGGTGSGKTTLLNVLSSFIPDNERIVTIEDSAELRLNQRHVVSLEARPADTDNAGAVTIRHLVTNSLRMRPERIIVGEVRSGEALDMLQAMNTGHDGSLTTLHSNTHRDALSRLETMVLMSGMDLPIKVIREQVASAIDLIVQQARLRDGSRKVTYITEVQGMEGDTIVLQDIFRFRETGTAEDGKVIGKLVPTGLTPKFLTHLEAHGQKVDRALFAG